jgi:hypothetical protein
MCDSVLILFYNVILVILYMIFKNNIPFPYNVSSVQQAGHLFYIIHISCKDF